ncbi:IMP cyclohydrolase [Angelakisella massiliensis]|uniref:IMP cyclohydrolase n=1 Tax=Angelakisella massiliensis TaxID=1871018 RepID=UPI0008F82233|nr:IMP cyclohydrolase [Angelakisella massiliensis]
MKLLDLAQTLRDNTYPGRGILLGKSACGNYGVIAYFIMGRSVNSRNRVFVEQDGGIRTQAFDPAKLADPSLIIYAPVRVLGDRTIVTNGDQTDTVYDYLSQGKTFEEALETRTFEPDGPNYTPRISGLVTVRDGNLSYKLSILKSAGGNPDSCQRFTFDYAQSLAGQGHFIHTYRCDGNPIPSFEGEPETVALSGDLDAFGDLVWENLNEDNKVSLFVRYIDLRDGSCRTRIYNKNN